MFGLMGKKKRMKRGTLCLVLPDCNASNARLTRTD